MKKLCLTSVIAIASASGALSQEINYTRVKLPEDDFLTYLGAATIASAACPGLAPNEQFANGYIRATGVAPQFHRAYRDSLQRAQAESKRDLDGFCKTARAFFSTRSKLAAAPLLIEVPDKSNAPH